MSRWMPAPIVGGAYSDDTKPFSAQDCVNWLPVMAERPGGRSPSMLRGAPGFSTFAVVGDGPIRGAHNAEGRLFVVSGGTLYLVNADSTSTAIGAIPGVGRVSIAHNQVAGGNEVVVANGQSGYVYNTADGTFGQITDEGFPGFKVCDFVDGYIVGVEPAGRYWLHSDLADATSYNTLDRAEAESQPDRIVTLIVTKRDVLVLGERTYEFFRNTGAATGTFQRIDGTEGDIGCAGPHAVVRMDNSVFMLGHDGIFYRLEGYNFRRISTHPIEQAVSRFNLSGCFATVFEDRGHKIAYFTFPDGLTFGYDVATGEWHRRESYGLSRWRLNTLTRWQNAWIGGDYTNASLYELDWDTSNEAGQPLESRRVSGVLHDNQNRLGVNAVELVFDTGKGTQQPGDWVGINTAGVGYTFTPTLPFSEVGGGTLDFVGDVLTGVDFSQSAIGAMDYGWTLTFDEPQQVRATVQSYSSASYNAEAPARLSSLGSAFASSPTQDSVSSMAPLVAEASGSTGLDYTEPGFEGGPSSFQFLIEVFTDADTRRVVQFRYSKDGGHNWSAWRTRSLGEVGDFTKRVTLRRLGQGRQWVFEVKVSDDVKRDLMAASMQIEGGDS